MRAINSLEDIFRYLPADIEDIVIVGGAEPSLSEQDEELIRNLSNPLFVYINHAVNSQLLQPLYPDVYYELLFVRGKDGGYHGVSDDGYLFFRPKSESKFIGVICIYPKEGYTLRSDFNKFSLGPDIRQEISQGYIANPKTGKRSPTSGYYAEMLARLYKNRGYENVRKREGGVSTTNLYTVGYGLDSRVPRFPAHNIDFEQEEQQRKFSAGELVSIGTIKKSHLTAEQRERR